MFPDASVEMPRHSERELLENLSSKLLNSIRYCFLNQLLSRGQGQQEKEDTVMELPVTTLGLLSDIGTLMLAKGFPAIAEQ